MDKLSLSEVVETVQSQHKCAILFMAECSSHSWGFANDESDHDIRFVYFKRPEDIPFYDSSSSIGMKLPGYDLLGFDLRHIFKMLTRSSLTSYEMIHSNHIYKSDDESVYSSLKQVCDSYYSRARLNDSATGIMKRLMSTELTPKFFQMLYRNYLIANCVQQGLYAPTHIDDLGRTLNVSRDEIALVKRMRDMSQEEFATFLTQNDIMVRIMERMQAVMATKVFEEEHMKGRDIDEKLGFANFVFSSLVRKAYS